MAPVLFLIAYLIDIVALVLHHCSKFPDFVDVVSKGNCLVLLFLIFFVVTCECSSDAVTGTICILLIGAIFLYFFPFMMAMLYTSAFIGTLVVTFLVVFSMLWTGHN